MFSGGESRGGGSWLCPVAVGRPRWSPVETVSPAAPSMGGEASSPLFGGVPGNGSGVPGGHAGPPQPASCGSLVGVPRQQRPVGRGATELSPPPPRWLLPWDAGGDESPQPSPGASGSAVSERGPVPPKVPAGRQPPAQRRPCCPSPFSLVGVTPGVSVGQTQTHSPPWATCRAGQWSHEWGTHQCR